MFNLSSLKWLLLAGWLCAGVAVGVSLFRPEPDLANPHMIALMRDAIEQNVVQIRQAAPEQPLKVEFGRFDNLPALGPTAAERGKVGKDEWDQLVQNVNQFVATANWGLGDPFSYGTDKATGGMVVTGFKSGEFRYANPFSAPPPEIAGTPIKSSSGLVNPREGWRIVGNGLELFLTAGAPQDEVEVGLDGATKEGANFVARSFRLVAPDGSGIRLSIGNSAVVDEKATRLQVETFRRGSDAILWSQKYQSGQYFLWHGRAFAAYEVAPRPPPEQVAKSGAPPDDETGGDDLVITKRINGRLTRVQLLGQATTNLIGARVGGYLPYLDGALKHGLVNRVTLTLDPELQYGAFYYLSKVLEKFDGHYGIGRPRYGSVTILDAESGGILAYAGFPSYEPDWAERRRVLINRDELLRRNPVSEAHMPGSAVKVLSVSLGYLLYGDARSSLLPASEDEPEVRQAFQDAYGIALTEPLLPPLGKPSPGGAAEERFAKVGGKGKTLPRTLQSLSDVFLVSATANPADSKMPPTESIISPNLSGYFDEKTLSDGLYPVTSRWPLNDAASMFEFWLYSLGGGEAKFTTLRLAAILATASSGKVVKPHIIESVYDRANTLWKAEADGVSDIGLGWNGIGSNINRMTKEMPDALKKVLLPGGTGHFLRDDGPAQYLGLDDPTTPINEESRRRGIDFGKSGTADYGDPPAGENRKFPDSIFVYRHGRYVIAVWLEQTDKGEDDKKKGNEYEKEMEGWNQNPAHKLTHRLVQLIETLENRR